MKKEKTIRTYQRRTKTGKVVTVKQHTAKYDAAEALKEAAKKKGAGDELENLKKKVKPEKVKVEKPAEDAPDYGFTADEYKAWYHWDQDADPKNKSALKVEKALKKQMGTKAYNKYFDEMSDNYSARGHNKAFKGLGDTLSMGDSKKKAAEAKTSKKSSTTPKKNAKDSDLVEHYDQFNKKSMGKAVGDSFTFSEGRGKDKFTYDARFVTDGKGRYGYVVRDKAEGPDAKYYVGINDGYESHSRLPAGLRKAAEAQGLRFKNGEFVKKETKGDRAVARMNKLVNEALSSTTSDPKALKKQLGALIDYNGGPMNRGDKIGKRIDEIREQLGKRSSKKRVDKKSDYDYETSMKNLENYFAEERRKITSKGKNVGSKKPLTSYQKHAINSLLNQSGWSMSKAEKYVRTLSDKEVRRLAHKDM